MAATIQIRRYTGPSATPVDQGAITHFRFSTSDNHYTTETTNPIPIPTAGTKYSYWVCTRLYASVTPTGTVNNLKWYTDGANGWTGVTMEVGTSSAYSQATGTPGDTGNELTDTNYTNGTLAPTDPAADNAFTYDVTTPLSVTGSISNPTTGPFGDYLALQLSVGSGASAGEIADETMTWQYDET